MSESCLTKDDNTIRRTDFDNQTITKTVDHMQQLQDEAFQDGLDLHLDGISVCLENSFGDDSAILGLTVHLTGNEGVRKDLETIGKKECNERRLVKLMKIKGREVGTLKMNFEPDNIGVAVKYRRKETQEMFYKTGERVGSLARVWQIPEGHELVGFHGGMNARDEIVELGIITRVASYPNMCQDAYREIVWNIHEINALNDQINRNNMIIDAQVDGMAKELHERLEEMDIDGKLEQVT